MVYQDITVFVILNNGMRFQKTPAYWNECPMLRYLGIPVLSLIKATTRGVNKCLASEYNYSFVIGLS